MVTSLGPRSLRAGTRPLVTRCQQFLREGGGGTSPEPRGSSEDFPGTMGRVTRLISTVEPRREVVGLGNGEVCLRGHCGEQYAFILLPYIFPVFSNCSKVHKLFIKSGGDVFPKRLSFFFF